MSLMEDATAALRRLRKHAAKFHKHRNKQLVISKYSKAADHADRATARQHSAHVAAWIAFTPSRQPGSAELKLLSKYLDLLGSGLLPFRLTQVLPQVQAVLRNADLSSAGAWKHESRQLQNKLQTLCSCREVSGGVSHCRAPREERKPAVVLKPASGVGGAQAEPQSQASSSRALACRASQPPSHQLFRKMNEWANLGPADRWEHLDRAKAILSASSLSQAELAQVLCTAAAAVSPLRSASSGDGKSLGRDLQETADGEGPNLQHLARRLLLTALRAWQASKFDCDCIAAVLDLLRIRIDDFEKKMGEVRFAACGAAWMAIKDALEKVQGRQCVEDPSPTSSAGAPQGARRAALEKAMTALGGRASLKQLVQHIGQNAWDFEGIDLEVLKGRLQKSGPPEYFQLQGKNRSSEDVFGFAEPCPTGVRRLRRGFAARISLQKRAKTLSLKVRPLPLPRLPPLASERLEPWLLLLNALYWKLYWNHCQAGGRFLACRMQGGFAPRAKGVECYPVAKVSTTSVRTSSE